MSSTVLTVDERLKTYLLETGTGLLLVVIGIFGSVLTLCGCAPADGSESIDGALCPEITNKAYFYSGLTLTAFSIISVIIWIFVGSYCCGKRKNRSPREGTDGPSYANI